MTLDEAKRFYMSYHGHSFHMGREEPVKYDSFRMLGIGEDTLRQWDEELLEKMFEEMLMKPEKAWSAHGEILKIVARGHCDKERYLDRLLDEMKNMEGLDMFNKTLIIENMAGRTESLKDGGAYVFSGYPCASKMNDVMEHLISSCTDSDSRLNEAIKRYRSAYHKYCLCERK